jgi:hypothetical protein
MKKNRFDAKTVNKGEKTIDKGGGVKCQAQEGAGNEKGKAKKGGGQKPQRHKNKFQVKNCL